MKIWRDDGNFTKEAQAYFWPNGEPTEELLAVAEFTQGDWGEGMEVIALLRDRWRLNSISALLKEGVALEEELDLDADYQYGEVARSFFRRLSEITSDE
jgi:hypothetical protein